MTVQVSEELLLALAGVALGTFSRLSASLGGFPSQVPFLTLFVVGRVPLLKIDYSNKLVPLF